jgi:hypothetical protein
LPTSTPAAEISMQKLALALVQIVFVVVALNTGV